MKRKWIITSGVLVVVLALGAAMLWHWPQNLVASMAYAAESGQALSARDQLKIATGISSQFELAAKSIAPSVVSITSSHTVHLSRMEPFFNDLFPQWFGQEFPQYFDRGAMEQRSMEQQSLGSGVIVSKDGYILTNNHVVQGADQLSVQLGDDRQYKAKLVGSDPKTDLAVLKIDNNDLTPAVLGDSDSLQVGQWVLAVGSPFGLRETVTAGIISAKGRANVGIADYEDLVQTDAAINQGNSGGPLIDLRGQVVGIDTAIATHNGGFSGVGFAIPIAEAHKVMDQLIKTGKVERAYLGVVIQPLTPELAKSFGYQGKEGVLISEVQPDAPAAKAGLKSGDIVMSLDGKAISTMAAFRTQIAESASGAQVKLHLWRDQKEQDLTATLGEMSVHTMPGATLTPGGPMPQGRLGLSLGDPTADLMQHYGLKSGTQGAVVLRVEPGSPADEAGIRPGDVIVQVQGDAVKDSQQAADLLDKQDLKQGVRLLARHGNMSRYIFLSVSG